VQIGVASLGAAVPLRLLVQSTNSPVSTRGQNLAAPGQSPVPGEDEGARRDLQLSALVAPLAVGTQLNRVTVSAIGVDQRGVGVVTLGDDRGHQWFAELARRSEQDATLNPVAISRQYALYLRNGGTGDTPTDDHVARAVMTIANHVKQNEQTVTGPELKSRAELWTLFGHPAETRA